MPQANSEQDLEMSLIEARAQLDYYRVLERDIKNQLDGQRQERRKLYGQWPDRLKKVKPRAVLVAELKEVKLQVHSLHKYIYENSLTGELELSKANLDYVMSLDDRTEDEVEAAQQRYDAALSEAAKKVSRMLK